MATNARQKMEHTFSIDFYSELEGRRYTGTFTCKKLSLRDQNKVNVRKVELNGGMHYTPDSPGMGIEEFADSISYMMAFLEVSLISFPDWWDLDELGDMEILGLVFKEAIKHQRRFRGEQGTSSGAEHSKSGEANSGAEAQAGDGLGSTREVVSEEVSSALEP